MNKRPHGTPPKEAEAGQKVIQAFMGLGVNNMKYCLDAMQKGYLKALKQHLAMLEREYRSVIAAEKKTRAKPAPTHRSKKNKSLTWSGRGSTPTWMRQEMKELKLKPNAFLIDRRA
ncbi:H-NS family nucleoid-associated regulatory protein [Tardiphaga sp. P9-11]|uniref:H-NS family nucleoid-associated regulatory protein n=1 Tax=Tardiphaga sp. P9-11 TaxID=2024614 RepID=UPI001561CECE|nr:H-NS family nucleoid-associated regulatory protein [Tardiphaga sp. P9-11]